VDAALLHDILENSPTGHDELLAPFGKRNWRIVREN